MVRLFVNAIEQHGPVSFKWFMEQSLYHPKYGYYTGRPREVGKKGDFFTNVSVGKLFGQLIARQAAEVWHNMGRPQVFTIMEQGAHDGTLANDMLGWLQTNEPELFAILSYWIVEPSKTLVRLQEEKLKDWPRGLVRWWEDFSDLDDGSLFGIFFCNELLDAFPVHMLTWRQARWWENYVDFDGLRFILRFGEPSTTELRNYIQYLMPPMPVEPYRTEVNLRALRWVQDLNRIMKRGYILICDYGLPRNQYLMPERREGTLTCYYQHHRVDNPFLYAGNCDMTTHVDFTSLADQAMRVGLRVTGYTDQHHFLVGLGQKEFEGRMTDLNSTPQEAEKALAAFRTLMHPNMMGSTFKYIAFERNMESAPGLTGFAHAGDPYAALGNYPIAAEE